MPGQWRFPCMLANDKFALISGTIIDFLGEIYVDNTDLIMTRPELTTAAVAHKELNRSASAWVAGLNTTGRALNPDKCKWTLADYC